MSAKFALGVYRKQYLRFFKNNLKKFQFLKGYFSRSSHLLRAHPWQFVFLSAKILKVFVLTTCWRQILSIFEVLFIVRKSWQTPWSFRLLGANPRNILLGTKTERLNSVTQSNILFNNFAQLSSSNVFLHLHI